MDNRPQRQADFSNKFPRIYNLAFAITIRKLPRKDLLFELSRGELERVLKGCLSKVCSVSQRNTEVLS